MTESFDSASIGFLFVELQTGLTFVNLALSARPDEADKRRLDTERAREAHDSYLKYRERVGVSEEQARKLDAELEKLRTALRRLGEAV